MARATVCDLDSSTLGDTGLDLKLRSVNSLIGLPESRDAFWERGVSRGPQTAISDHPAGALDKKTPRLMRPKLFFFPRSSGLLEQMPEQECVSGPSVSRTR